MRQVLENRHASKNAPESAQHSMSEEDEGSIVSQTGLHSGEIQDGPEQVDAVKAGPVSKDDGEIFTWGVFERKARKGLGMSKP